MKSILIDADSLIYIIAYHHKDSEEFYVHQACDSLLTDIFNQTDAEQYLGVFSDPQFSWREEVYRFAPYKGTRPDKPEWVTKWSSTIKEYFISLGGFYELSHGLEADDVLGIPFEGLDITLCSPDKDIKQIKGVHYDYKKREFVTVTEFEAAYNKCMLLLCGDTSDNIKGIPGLGEVKAAKLLKECTDIVDLYSKVSYQYFKTFGDFYGPIIKEETEITVNIDFAEQPERIKAFLQGINGTLFKPTPKIHPEELLRM